MEPDIYKDCYLEMDHRRHEVRVQDSVVALTLTEWNLLAVFVLNPGRVIQPEELWLALRGKFHVDIKNSVKWHIKHLRGKMHFALNAPIVTVRSVGYRYDAQTTGGLDARH